MESGSTTEISIGSRSTRKAATKAALAIKNEALDEINGLDTSIFKVKKEQRQGNDAFAAIMSSSKSAGSDTQPSTTKATRAKKNNKSQALSTSTTPQFDNVANIPDLEDLISEASVVRTNNGRHDINYHHFNSGDKECLSIQENLLAWYDVNYRRLPWRKSFHLGENSIESEQQNPGQRAYEVWVSEIMCQQTQVATVIPYYNKWISKWPTIASLAAEPDLEQINKVWAGLGYYSRASRLHQGAQKVVKEFNGVLPSDPTVLEKEIPGVGRYTAGAIASHAYNVPAELVDGNVIRVLSRLRAIGGDVKSPKVIDLHWQVAKELIEKKRPGCFNQALMELGATVCTPQNPTCGECPVLSSCRAYAEVVDRQRHKMENIGLSKKRKIDQDDGDDGVGNVCTLCIQSTDVDNGQVTQYPRKAAKKAPRDEECAVTILERIRKIGDDGVVSEFLLVKRPEKGLLAGMWEFPTVEQDQLADYDHDHDDDDSTKQEKSLKKEKAVYVPSSYKSRSLSSSKFLSRALGLAWFTDTVVVSRKDLGSVQHLFSHIKKVYHAEWVLVQAVADSTPANVEQKHARATKNGIPEMVWLSEQELATAAIPTGINKTFQLLQKLKSTNTKKGLAANKSTKEKAVAGEGETRSKRKRVSAKREEQNEGQTAISKFFKST